MSVYTRVCIHHIMSTAIVYINHICLNLTCPYMSTSRSIQVHHISLYVYNIHVHVVHFTCTCCPLYMYMSSIACSVVPHNEHYVMDQQSHNNVLIMLHYIMCYVINIRADIINNTILVTGLKGGAQMRAQI